MCLFRGKNSYEIDLTKIRFSLYKKGRYLETKDSANVGDYVGNRVSAFDTGYTICNNAILFHEQFEYMLCSAVGITPEMIDKFDTDPAFRKKHKPIYFMYRKFHRMALKAERQYIEAHGINWKSYDKFIENLIVPLKGKRE